MKTLHFRVTGKVQGVWFRGATCQQASLAKVQGWVRNMADGSVEGVLQGTPEAVDQVLLWLHDGPIWARVDKVEITALETSERFTDFSVHRS